MAVTETIQELLQGIDDAQYGRDMRQYIHKGIQKCYEEGSAGETDLTARERLDVIEGSVDKWYKLPVTIENVTPSSDYDIECKLIINPFLKLLDIHLAVANGSTAKTHIDGTVTQLPIIMPYNNQGTSYRDIMLFSKDSSNNVIITPAAIQNYSTQSKIIFSGSFAATKVYSGSIRLPYYDLCADHPLSEAELIVL